MIVKKSKRRKWISTLLKSTRRAGTNEGGILHMLRTFFSLLVEEYRRWFITNASVSIYSINIMLNTNLRVNI
jgi:hypothetical protein